MRIFVDKKQVVIKTPHIGWQASKNHKKSRGSESWTPLRVANMLSVFLVPSFADLYNWGVHSCMTTFSCFIKSGVHLKPFFKVVCVLCTIKELTTRLQETWTWKLCYQVWKSVNRQPFSTYFIYWQFGVHRLEELGLVGKQNLKGTGVHFLTFLKTFWVWKFFYMHQVHYQKFELKLK